MTGPIEAANAMAAMLGVRAAPRRGEPGFRVDAGPEAGTPAASVAGSGAVSSAWLLGVQEHAGDLERDRAAHRRVREVLAELARLQRELLGAGGLRRATLDALAEVARDVPQPADPALRALLAAAVLRARLELARQGAERSQPPASAKGAAFAPSAGN